MRGLDSYDGLRRREARGGVALAVQASGIKGASATASGASRVSLGSLYDSADAHTVDDIDDWAKAIRYFALDQNNRLVLCAAR